MTCIHMTQNAPEVVSNITAKEKKLYEQQNSRRYKKKIIVLSFLRKAGQTFVNMFTLRRQTRLAG